MSSTPSKSICLRWGKGLRGSLTGLRRGPSQGRDSAWIRKTVSLGFREYCSVAEIRINKDSDHWSLFFHLRMGLIKSAFLERRGILEGVVKLLCEL